MIFCVLLFAADMLVGYAMHWMSSHAQSGQALKNHEVEDLITPDILILGSSRSTHHYIPSTLEDSLKQDVYIAGQDGHGIVLMWPVFRYIANRKKPQMVIYDITESFDIYDDDEQKYLRYIRPIWGRSADVDNIIRQTDPVEPVKLIGQTYRYNGSLPSLIKGMFHGEIYNDGYSPLYGSFRAGNENNTATSTHEYSSLKLRFFNDMMHYASDNGIDMLFVISPHYNGTHVAAYDTISDMAHRYGFRLVDYSCDSTFTHNKALFKDPVHLNVKGAEKFTQIMLHELQ